MSWEFIEAVTTENTGGGTMVDFVILKDGRILGVNDDCVCLYNSMEHFYEHQEVVPTIELIDYGS